jgi:hypothetical protein
MGMTGSPSAIGNTGKDITDAQIRRRSPPDRERSVNAYHRTGTSWAYGTADDVQAKKGVFKHPSARNGIRTRRPTGHANILGFMRWCLFGLRTGRQFRM